MFVRHRMPIAILVFVLGCGGKALDAPGPAGSGSSSGGSGSSNRNSGSSLETGAGEGNEADVPDSDGGLDASLDWAFADGDAQASAISWDGRVPLDHRASASACPPQRDSGSPCADGSVPDPTDFACTADSNCTMGANGRCLSAPAIVPPSSASAGSGPVMLYCETMCSYDQCFSDSDCAVAVLLAESSHVPCACRYPSIYGAPNLCLTLSNCAVDSDCGREGFCSPSSVSSIGEPAFGYFCHTPSDLCIDDTDCNLGGNTTSSCQYNVSNGHWFCYTFPRKG
jgi:hypothetical protein